MILINGCSFTYGTQLKDSTYSYSHILQKMLPDEEILDISEESKCNNYMIFELLSYLHKFSNNSEKLPKIVVLQTTDSYRTGLPDWHSSGTWIPNNIESIIHRLDRNRKTEYTRRFVKIVHWQQYFKILKKMEVMFEEGLDEKALRHKRSMGMGTSLHYDDAKPKAKRYKLGDETFIYDEMNHALGICNLQNLCKKLNVRLIIMNYYGFSQSMLQDPVVKNIDRDDYLLDNAPEFGMYNHLLQEGFGRTEDEYHFNEAAHYYQAKILYDFITKDQKIIAHEITSEKLDKFPVFDYTNGSTVFDPNKYSLDHNYKQYLLDRIFSDKKPVSIKDWYVQFVKKK